MSSLRLTFLLTLVLAVSARGPLLAQLPTPPPGNGFISGQVIEGGTTRPVPGATVSLVSVTLRTPAREVIADSQGRYVFSGLPAGEFRLTAWKPGWRAGAYGLATPVEGISSSAGAFTLAAGERGRAAVPVWRNAIIRGRVTDESGEPLPGARVSAMHWLASRGHRILGSGGDLGIADDRGEFTMSVRPGEYMIAATSEQVRIVNGRPQVFRQTFFPRSFTTSGAATIAVKSGEERNGLALRLSLEPAFRITGVMRVVDAGRMPRLQLIDDGGDGQRFPLRTPDPQGRFVFDNVPAGRYVLRSASLGFGSQDPSQSTELWVQTEVDVTNRDLDLIVNAHRPLLVSGRVRLEGAGGDGAALGVRLLREDELPLTDVSPAFVPARADGTFTLAVAPGRYVVASFGEGPAALRATPTGGGTPRRWNLRDATSGGNSDAADLPFAVTSDISGLELTLTDAATRLSGRVTSRQGSVAPSLVIVFPAEERFWDFTGGRRIAIRRSSADGTYELRNLPEGNYFVAAVRGGPNEYEARNPALLEALARTARRVTVLNEQTTTQDVELVAAPATNVARLSLLPGVVAAERAIVRDVPAPTLAAWATISGTVVAAGSNAPIAGARVGITPGVGGAPNAGGAYTDSQGRFALAEVPAGQHTLYVTRPPYVSTVYGAATPADPGTPVTVAGGQRLSDLKIAMLKGAAISGTVTDQNGQPLAGVQVGIRAYRWTARGRELVPPPAPTIFGTRTDELGQYRAYGLAPADYIVQALIQGAPTAMPLTTQADVDAATKPSTTQTAVRTPVPVMYTPMFFPNTPDPSAAQTVRLRSGDEMAIDFQFRLMPTATVSGIVRTVDGSTFNRVSVNLSQNDPLGPSVPRSRVGSADSTGAFTITGVPPGRYLVTTSPFGAGSTPLSGALELFVDRDLSGVVLDVVPMSTVTGTVRGESIAILRQPTVRLSLSPPPGTFVAPNTSRSATIGPDDRFSIPNVPPGRYRFELTGPNTIVKPRTASQRVQGIETVDSGLVVKGGETLDVDVELVTSEASVGGRLRDLSGQSVTSPYVVLFANDSGSWTPPSRRIFGVRPDQNGRYLFPDVPAGDYLITTLAGVDAGEWFDPSVLAKLAPAASPVTVRRRDKLEIDLETR